MPITRTRTLGPVGELLLGSVLLCAGAALLYFLAANYTMTCQRSGNSCTLQRERIFQQAETIANLQLSDITGAEIQEVRSSKGKSHYEVMLLTGKLRVPFSDSVSSSDYASCSRIAAEINRFIGSSEESLSLRQSATMVKIVGFFVAAVGIYVLLHGLMVLSRRIFRLVMLVTR